MNTMMKSVCAAVALLMLGSVAFAKLPAPVLSDEAKAKAAEAKAKTAWTGKLEAFQLCKSQDKVVAHYKKVPLPKEGKPAKGAASAPAGSCVDPGPFVYVPEVPAAAPAAPAAPAASAAEPAKKS
jgi:hypothetical protein